MDPTNWLPTYPDVLAPARSRRVWDGALVPHSTQAYPVPDTLANLTFAPRFPDRVPARRSPTAWIVSSFLDPVTIYPLAWLPIFPERVPHVPPLLQPLTGDPSFGYGAVVAASLAWQAVYPERVPVVVVLRPGGEPFWVDPSLIGLAPCVHVALDAASATGFIAPVAVSTTFIDPAFQTTDLIGEDLC